jgi:hypothetical protein
MDRWDIQRRVCVVVEYDSFEKIPQVEDLKNTLRMLFV